MNIFLQVWGGVFYLLNKIFFSLYERKKIKKIKKYAWVVYLIGLPAWVFIFIQERNWIAASIEASGAISMILGLTISIRGIEREPRWLNYISLIFVIFGIGYSVYDFKGIHTINQFLEIGIVSGFLIGTYTLAKEKRYGYLFFMLMNISNTLLMWREDYLWLALQQVISLLFVVDAYKNSKNKN